MKRKGFLIIILLSVLYSCERFSTDQKYKTKNVIILIIDGARYSETWGDTSSANIPHMKNISRAGVLFTNFYNNGPTYTLAGQSSITTGNYQEINNSGFELPRFPSFFQYWNKKYAGLHPVSKVFASKDKLSALSDCIDSTYSGKYRTSFDCGVNGLGAGSGYRHDSITLRITLNALNGEHPKLVLVCFREPDFSAHKNNWNAYIEGIKNTDNYVFQLWNFLESNTYYKGSTALFITYDHGRHLDNVKDGYISHGDSCDGCRHISLLAFGPDFKKGEVIKINRELIDIPTTIAEILRFPMPTGHGSIMRELFK